MDLNVLSVVVLQILAVGTIAVALLLYLLGQFKRPRVELGHKAVFVTDCDSAVGYECAKRLDRLGLRVFAGHATTDGDRARALKAEASDRLHLVEFDASNCERIERAVEYIQQHLPADENGLWALVNTTSECIGGLLEKLSWEQCERQVHINLVGAIRVTKAFLPLLKRRKGRLVSLVGLGGQPGYPGFSVYASCKAGLESFFEALRYEMQRYDVRFITVSPTIRYQFESRADPEKDPADVILAESKFGNRPKVCVLDVATRQAALADLEDAVMSAHPLSHYTSFPTQNRFCTVAYSYLPSTWKRQKLARDFQSNFLTIEDV